MQRRSLVYEYLRLEFAVKWLKEMVRRTCNYEAIAKNRASLLYLLIASQ